jgi:hypothetical protein
MRAADPGIQRSLDDNARDHPVFRNIERSCRALFAMPYGPLAIGLYGGL